LRNALKVLTRNAMTDHVGTVTTDNGYIGAIHCEGPEGSRDLVAELADKLDTVGFRGFRCIG
jgi:hypothetical protein